MGFRILAVCAMMTMYVSCHSRSDALQNEVIHPYSDPGIATAKVMRGKEDYNEYPPLLLFL